jgi:uncharacterized protein YpuA (DUF1002 family)
LGVFKEREAMKLDQQTTEQIEALHIALRELTEDFEKVKSQLDNVECKENNNSHNLNIEMKRIDKLQEMLKETMAIVHEGRY